MYKSHVLQSKEDFQDWIKSISVNELIDVTHPINAEILPKGYPCISMVVLSDDDVNWIVNVLSVYPEDFANVEK